MLTCWFTDAQTILPLNVYDPETTVPCPVHVLPLSTPTPVSQSVEHSGRMIVPRLTLHKMRWLALNTSLLAMRKLSDLMARFHVKMRSITNVDEHLEHALKSHGEIVALLDFCPVLAARSDGYVPQANLDDPFDFVSISRFTLAIGMAGRRVEVFRSLFRRSYSELRFMEARKVCKYMVCRTWCL